LQLHLLYLSTKNKLELCTHHPWWKICSQCFFCAEFLQLSTKKKGLANPRKAFRRFFVKTFPYLWESKFKSCQIYTVCSCRSPKLGSNWNAELKNAWSAAVERNTSLLMVLD
jgi:hypothetical protein